MTNYITSYKELLAQREAARVAAEEIKALPELTGTEKQVNWALDIRAKKFANLNEMLADMNAKTTDEQMRRQNQIALQAAKNVLASKTDSRFWIDNRLVEARKLIADNNLQDDLKAEFARLTAAEEKNQDAPEVKTEVKTEVEVEEYAITTAALQVATEAEENAAKRYWENQTRNLAESIANIDVKNIALKSTELGETSLCGMVLSVHDDNDKFVIDAEKAETRGIFISLATYDTVAQVETVINMLKAAIDRSASEFIFPPVEELTTPDPEDNNNGNNGNNGNNNNNGNDADRANEEIINCTDDIIITDDAYTQMIHTELANAQIATGNYGIEINGEWVFFTNHKITRINAEDKLGFSFEYTLQGRKQFRHNGRVISRDGIIKFFENKDIAAAQEKSFREFFINPDAPKHGFFQVQISPTFADSCEHNYSRYFEYYNDAINFINNAIKFCGDVPTHITIKRDKQAGKVYYHRMPDGTVHVDKPDTDFFKHYSADEIQARIDEIDRAIADNTQFRNENDSPIIGVAILNANDQLAVTRNFYEFVLHENAHTNESATNTTPEYKYYIKSRRPIFGAAPNGYIKAISGEVCEPVRRPNGTYSPKCRIYFATVIYDKPLTDEQILNYDLAVSNETFELLNTKTETAETKIDRLFDAYESESGNNHLAHGYIATVYYQQGMELHWRRGTARNYGTIDTAIDAINYVCRHDTDKITRSAAVFFRHSRFNEDKIYARNEFGMEYFTEYYDNAIVETDGSEEDDFADEMPALYPAEDSDDDDELIDLPSERYDGYIGDDQVSYWHGKLIYITSSKYGASMNLHPEAIKILGKYLVQIPDGKWRKFVRPDENKFWQMMIERGACTINNELPQNVNRTKTITPDEMLAIVDTLDTVNASAPAGWQIDYNGKNFPVKFNGKTVATLDSLALAKVLPPDKFFDRFNPDVPPKEQYINDRRKELDQLLDFRKFVEDDPARLKTLANLIEDVKREILEAELDTEHPPDIEFNENGDVIPWF